MVKHLSRIRAAALAPVLVAACSAPSDGPPVSAPAGADPRGAPGLALGALDGDLRTIPYGGYVDFDGEPVNAGGVDFNFAIFPCATPGPGAGQCAPLWVAKGAWNNTPADWKLGWPTGAGTTIGLPIFSGRFTVELGGTGQNALPEALFESTNEVLYLGIQVEGRALGALQKLAPAFKTISALEGDRLRIRSAVEIDDPAGGSVTLEADHGLVIGHTSAGQDPLMRVENSDGETPFEVRADGTVLANRFEGDGAVQVVAAFTNEYRQAAAVFTNGPTGFQTWDDTVPQRDEGMHVVELTLTPARATNLLVVDATFQGVELTNLTDHLALCLFRGNSSDAIACTVIDQNFNGAEYAGLINTVNLHYAFPAGTTEPLTLELRAGFVAAPLDSTLCMNGGAGSRRLGGTLQSGMTVKEYR